MADAGPPFTWHELLPNEVITRLELALLRHREAARDHLAHGREKAVAELLATTALGETRVLRPLRAPDPHRALAWPTETSPPEVVPAAPGPEVGPSGSIVRFTPRPRP